MKLFLGGARLPVEPEELPGKEVTTTRAGAPLSLAGKPQNMLYPELWKLRPEVAGIL